MAAMFGSSSSITSGHSLRSHPQSDEAVAELLRQAALRRKRSAVLLALTGELLADTRELLERCSIAMNRARYPGRRRRRSKRAAILSRKLPRRGEGRG